MTLPRSLSKFVHDAARLSRRQVVAAHQQGQLNIERARVANVRTSVQTGVQTNAQIASLDHLVYENDLVWLSGCLLQLPLKHSYAILNKPEKTLCVIQDPKGKGDLGPWLEKMPQGMFAVGRLDRDTTGALLLTTDGDLANCLLRPERHADKLYHLQIASPLENSDPRLQAFLEGIDVGPYTAKAKKVEVQSSREGMAQLAVTLDEGKHRQIRRMCRTVKLPLRNLHRYSFGPVTVQNMAQGDWRLLAEGEVSTLWNAAGGRKRLELEQHQALASRARRHRAEGRADLRLEQWLEANPEQD